LDIPVEEDKIETLLEAALMSPSSKNRKPWEFVVISEKETLILLSQCREHGAQMLSESPLAIVVMTDPTVSDCWIEDGSIAAFNIQLQAQSLGLGSVWVQIRDRKKSDNQSAENYISKLLGIPDNFRINCIVSIGYPNETKLEHNENELIFNKINYERFNLNKQWQQQRKTIV